MSGVERVTHTDQLLQRREARESRLLRFIQENRPIAAIAALESLEKDYCTKIVMELVSSRGLAYNPPRRPSAGLIPVPGLGEGSRRLRAKLGDELHYLSAGKLPGDVALTTGVKTKAQRFARDRPFNFDWTLSNIERLAEANGKTFRQVVLEGILTAEELRCLTI